MKLSEFALLNYDFGSVDEMFEFFIIARRWEETLRFSVARHVAFLKIPKFVLNLQTIELDRCNEFSYIARVLFALDLNFVAPSTGILKFMALLRSLDLRLYVPLLVASYVDQSIFDGFTRPALLRFYYEDDAGNQQERQRSSDLEADRMLLLRYKYLL